MTKIRLKEDELSTVMWLKTDVYLRTLGLYIHDGMPLLHLEYYGKIDSDQNETDESTLPTMFKSMEERRTSFVPKLHHELIVFPTKEVHHILFSFVVQFIYFSRL